MPGGGLLGVRQVAGDGATDDAAVGEGFAVAVASVPRVRAPGRAAFGMHPGGRMDETATPGATCPGWAAGLAAGQVRLASAGAASLDAPRRAAVGRGQRGMTGMARGAVGRLIGPHRAPTPAARSTREDGPPSEPSEVAPKLADAGVEFASGNVAGREGPENRPFHSLGQGVVSVQQPGDSRPFIVGAASDVAGQRGGHAQPAATMDEDSDQGAVAQGARSLVEPESPLDVAVLVGTAAALTENVRQVSFGCVAFGRIAKQPGERVGGPSRWPSPRGFHAPTADLLPCMYRSGMHAAGGSGSGRGCE